MGHPQIGVILCDPTHSFVAANEWMGHMCVVISLRKTNAGPSASVAVATSAQDDIIWLAP
jgi:hypothetical protein